MTEFAIGDVVRLKSGGPAMTVHWVTDDAVEVCWFTADGSLHASGFEATTLVSAGLPPDAAASSEDIVVTEAMIEAGRLAWSVETRGNAWAGMPAIYRAMETERRRGDK